MLVGQAEGESVALGMTRLECSLYRSIIPSQFVGNELEYSCEAESVLKSRGCRLNRKQRSYTTYYARLGYPRPLQLSS